MTDRSTSNPDSARDSSHKKPGRGDHREFTRELLRDLQALERMVAEDQIESDVCRIGAEQELFIVDRNWMPAPLSSELLEELDDSHFTTELARYNLEVNLDPLVLSEDCLTDLETQLRNSIAKAEAAARNHGGSIVLAGILPTLSRQHVSLGYMTPAERYRQLNETMTRLRGGPYDLRIKGRDEMMLRHDNVMLEACNTSFQIHLQVSGQDFIHRYNVAQMISGPVLAATTNSPVLFDRQLWSETRIALFQQGTDERSPHLAQFRSKPPRVSFGARWLERSAVEVFEEDIARFRTLFGGGLGENSIGELAAGRVPQLLALRQHNGTVYRWNRPCYGVSEGRPHLRIECRYIPAGPSIVDEVANAALWLGLMVGASKRFENPADLLPFGAVRRNFLRAARSGLAAQFLWLDGKQITAQRLLLDELIPLAREGLLDHGCAADDIDRYLDIIEARVDTRTTGANWLVRSHDMLSEVDTISGRAAGLVQEMHAHQQSGKPVHEWPTLEPSRPTGKYCATVDQIMTTDLFTIHPDELIHLAAHVMDWKHVRHVPVEDERQRLVGLISHRVLLRVLSRQATAGESSSMRARDIMATEVIVVTPDTPTLDAIELMGKNEVSCLPVVNDHGELVGILTERDLVRIATPLLRRFLNHAQNGDTVASDS
ncbi:MAG: CBS domain-containing protein [Acidobacteria bacterium]|nr:CBS domain-containing protein [Acidobacteriota bacterium]NIM60144.1 CBS domain-containing protein [Acidobacteriota bacterium]NIO57813.1 CBS domain-containing protein [Acidobacteriota bacterium]NIQ28822.1 CBS domain-containing protein [Acidobacteriota bacterium]NIQ83280.1 CBS domain-containing protein [Acidobacteriota bacterium]